ncbi:PREDICTED: uncharacterized protein LOC105145716 [Acromyrmex echinatior]|uniref:uncharacterized protein LOC105145716 n=1 Tax=Acromyrmex echinatior TaxID=103372 RepID=UPI000580E4FF|nr:PREDICTED: uncharacterized protein LOC105145716 [Acromyrmex echinatior]
MRRKVMLKEVISVVKLSLFPVWGWPLPQDTTKFKIFCVKLHHYLCIILGLGLMVPLTYGITNYLDDPITLVNQILVLSSTSHAIANFIFEIVNYHRIQNVTFEMVHFCDLMKPHEEVVIQRYINKCIMFHSICLFFIYFPITIAVPVLLHQPFPVIIKYPFNISYQPVKTIIFIHQSMMAIMIAGQLCMNILMALLLWFTSARFEILIEELRKITNVYQLFKCIKKHQELLKYAREVTIAARPFAFSTICCSTVCLILVFLLVIKKL